MCGRFSLGCSPDDLRDEFGLAEAPFDYRPRYNVAPSQDVYAITLREGAPRAKPYRWGLVPYWTQGPSSGASMINARAETLLTRPSFRDALARRRCLVPADGFYEWQRVGRVKIPMYVRLASGRPFAFAGLWERWRAPDGAWLFSCTIITTDPNELLRPVHDRMPVILEPAQRERWLDPATPLAELRTLLHPYAGDDLIAYQVSRLVNSPDNDIAECIQPVTS